MTSERWRVVYAGFRFYAPTNDRAHIYYRIDDSTVHAAAGRELRMKKELLPASPGAVLDISVKLDGDGVSVYGKDRTYADLRWDAVEPDFVAAWAAEDRANTALAHAARHAKKNEFEERLKPIRVAYINMAAPQRAQLIAQVVRYISGGG